MEEANKLIGTGKKHLVMGKVVEAVGVLQEACGMLAKKYGDTADECGEAFFWCGKALLDLARMENTVLGNALEGVPEEEEEEKPKDSNVESTEDVDEKTRDELRVQVYDAMAEKKNKDASGEKSESTEKNGDANKDEAGDVKQSEAKEEGGEKEQTSDGVNGTKAAEGEEQGETQGKENGKKTEVEKESAEEQKESESKPEDAEAGDGEENEEGGDDAEMEGDAEQGDDAEAEGDAEGQGEGTDEKDSDDEEVGNLQLAWEMLEVAKVIYKRKDNKEDQLMAAQAHLKLGEVSSESGNYSQAAEDFQECLKLQLKHLDSDSRLLAETHYQLGLTYTFSCQYSQAIEHLNSSSSVIKSRLDKLQEVIDKAEGPEGAPEERKEMEELKALLPEIQEKVEDATEGLKTASADAEAMKDVLNGSSTSSALPGSTVQSSDTSASSAVSCTVQRVHITTKTTNGVSAANGHTTTAPVSDISHLVRKKRKPEDSPVKEGESKKVKQEDAHTNGTQEPHTNGVHATNGDTTDHTKKMEVESQ
ncbi:histone-binding protein N1/N2-like isoform X2 [Myripristis murdjan]|uniref:histone-binding protein N1/N2-like isoform X2 n=1 Tax=Myripristis murdjan TaxID=586833 RepID=UPI001175CFDD|nr:histone-binding protein N1/N2-like isoform X2 [Myripristis murdjan]